MRRRRAPVPDEKEALKQQQAGPEGGLDGPGEVFGFPKTVGHYSFHPVPAVTIQLQVAP